MNPVLRIVLAVLVGIAAWILAAWGFSSVAAPSAGFLGFIVGTVLGVITYYSLPVRRSL